MARLALPAAMAALLLSSPAAAHEAMSGWRYPISCCSDRDCAVVSAEAVREVRGGYIVSVKPGTHPMWPATKDAPAVFNIPAHEGAPSPDGQFHICISPSGARLCFFAAIGGS